MNNVYIFKNQIINYCSNEKKRYDIWVYADNDILKVFKEKKPNTIHLWFEFYAISNLYWSMMEQLCIEKIKDSVFYNHSEMKLFMIKYLFCDTNVPNIKLHRLKTGQLTKQSFESAMRIHPRIWRVLFEMIDFFPQQLDKEEEKKLQKQCAILFGQGDNVSNPHNWIVTYCNLMAFWEKFGMNYYDILKLPYETFSFLRKLMSLQSNYRNKSISEKTNSSAKNKRGVRF